MKKIGIIFLILVLVPLVNINATEEAVPTPTATTIVTATAKATPTLEPTPNITPTPELNTPTPTPDSVTPSPTPDGETPSPTPDGETPSPTPEGETPSPTPEGETPSPTPEGETPSPTPTAEVKKTPKPTNRPVISEPTKDPYNREWQTQAPPTMPAQITAKPITTPVAGITETEDTPPPFVSEQKNDINVFLYICLSLILVLIVDIYIIMWRKRMGCGTQLNGGISRRKVQDLCDYPEETEIHQENKEETEE